MFRGVFIRAPAIIEVGPGVEVLAECPVLSKSHSNPTVEAEEVCHMCF